MQFEFQDPPGSQSRRSRLPWKEIVTMCKSRPNEWLCLGAMHATSLYTGSSRNGLEGTARNVQAGGLCDGYVRYVPNEAA